MCISYAGVHSQESCKINLRKFLHKKLASNFDASFFVKETYYHKKQRQKTQTTKRQIVKSLQTSWPITSLNFGHVSASFFVPFDARFLYKKNLVQESTTYNQVACTS